MIDKEQHNYESLNMTRHCFFVTQKLWGTQHDAERRRATLLWYRDATLRSVRNAAATAPEHVFVQVHLFAADHYASNQTHDILFARFDDDDDDNNDDETVPLILNHHSEAIATTIAERQCGVVSFVRLDADDLLQSEAFRIIDTYWSAKKHHAMWDNRNKRERIRKRRRAYCRTVQSPCPFVALSCTTAVRRIAVNQRDDNNKNNNNETAVSCQMAPQPIPRNNCFSTGLTTTLPVSLWLSSWSFRGDILLAWMESHDFMLDAVKERVQGSVQVWEHRVSANDHYALWTKTPLSSHYRSSSSNNSNDDECRNLPGVDDSTARILREAGASVPALLSPEQVQQNSFLGGS